MTEQEKKAVSVYELVLWTLWKRVCTGLEQNKCDCTAYKESCQNNQPPLKRDSAGLHKVGWRSGRTRAEDLDPAAPISGKSSRHSTNQKAEMAHLNLHKTNKLNPQKRGGGEIVATVAVTTDLKLIVIKHIFLDFIFVSFCVLFHCMTIRAGIISQYWHVDEALGHWFSPDLRVKAVSTLTEQSFMFYLQDTCRKWRWPGCF